MEIIVLDAYSILFNGIVEDIYDEGFWLVTNSFSDILDDNYTYDRSLFNPDLSF